MNKDKDRKKSHSIETWLVVGKRSVRLACHADKADN